jgi:hypothetical protein
MIFRFFIATKHAPRSTQHLENHSRLPMYVAARRVFLGHHSYIRVASGSAPRCRRFRLGRGMSYLRRRVFVETSRGRVSAGFTVPAGADAADVSMALRRRGWSPYRLRLEAEQHAWIAVVID